MADQTVVGIDVGSSKVCTLVGEVGAEGGIRVLGVGVAAARGIRQGVVTGVQEATASIAASVEKAERISGYVIERAYVGLSGTHVSSLNSRGVVGISRREHGITVEDLERVLEAANAIEVPHNHEVVHVLPRGYIVDGQDGVRDPIGMHGFRLEVEAHIVIGASSAIQNLVKCVEGAGVGVDEVVLAGVAAGGAVLTETEREMGVVLADIGAGTTDIAVFIDGTVWHTATLGVGGEHITNDIAIVMRMPPEVAERVKIEHGHALAEQVPPDERFVAPAFGGEGRQVIPRWELAEVIEARVEEILQMIQQEIKRSGYDGLLPAGMVVCGGTAQLPGLRELGMEVLNLPVRIGTPQDIHGLVDRIGGPAYAVGVGLMGWGLTADTRPQLRRPTGGVGGRVFDWLRGLLPG